MPVTVTSDPSATLEVGQPWPITLQVTDIDGAATSATVAVVVTSPAAGTTTPTVTALDTTGAYRAVPTVTSAGRWTAVITVSGAATGTASVTAWVASVVTAAGMPTAADVRAYVGDTSADDTELGGVLAAEAAAQRARCQVPAAYPPDLREALLRRCARNLAARRVPVASFTAFEGGGTSTRVPARDPEIRRLEAPYRRYVVG